MEALIDRLKIGIIGLSTGAGSGFLATSIARALVDQQIGYHPAVLELGNGGLFDSLGMDKLFYNKNFFSFHQAVACDKSIRGRRNELDGINWALLPSGENAGFLDLYRKIRLLNNVSGDVILCRLSGVEGEDLWRLMWEMDRVLVVIDPLPSKMLNGYNFLCKLRVSELSALYVVNKYNKGVNRRELLDYIKLKGVSFLPMVDQVAIYGAEYNCRTVYDMPIAKKVMIRPINTLIKNIFTIDK